MLNLNRTGRGGRKTERPPKVTTTKIRIVIRSFDHPFLNHFWGLPRYTRKIGLPESRVLYTVLRSPHIDKKSREQFEMEIQKKFLVIITETHELRKKFFRLKRQRIFGAQYEILFYCKTRSDKGKLQRLLRSKILALTLS
uniref:ribosomal protein S10 n=1 Tax=Magnolia figo TaxID=13612 RepID=UPI00286BA59B|nr:ribosomal protein S10 [Magnolia figo]WLR81231.1 ribosomal protein S10 [Magnolia figo]